MLTSFSLFLHISACLLAYLRLLSFHTLCSSNFYCSVCLFPADQHPAEFQRRRGLPLSRGDPGATQLLPWRAATALWYTHTYNIWLSSNSRQGSVKVLTFDYKEALIIRLGYQSHWPWPDLVSDIIKRQQTNVLTYYTNTAVKGQCHWQFLKEMCVPLQESPLRKRRKNRTRR